MRNIILKWDYLSRYRSWLFSVSIVLVMFSHYFEDVVGIGSGSMLRKIADIFNGTIGTVGVDIFCLLSGMGLYYSYSKNSDTRSFYKRRFCKLLLPYVTIGGLFWIIKDLLILRLPLTDFVWDFTMISFWTDGCRTTWFVSFIAIMYIVFPVLYRMINVPKFHSFVITMLICAIFTFSLIWLSCAHKWYYANTELALWRCLPFVIGTYLGAAIKNNWLNDNKLWILIGAGVVLKVAYVFATFKGINFFPTRLVACFWAISLSYIVAILIDRFRFGIFEKANLLISALTLELYLSHVVVRHLLRMFDVPTNNILVFMGYIALSFVVSIAYGRLKSKL